MKKSNLGQVLAGAPGKADVIIFMELGEPHEATHAAAMLALDTVLANEDVVNLIGAKFSDRPRMSTVMDCILQDRHWGYRPPDNQRRKLWRKTNDPRTGREYYWNTATRESRWTRPEEMDAAPASDYQAFVSVLLVSKAFRRAFALALAQSRWDTLTRKLTAVPFTHSFHLTSFNVTGDAADAFLYHSVAYYPRGCQLPPDLQRLSPLPPEGIVVLTHTNVHNLIMQYSYINTQPSLVHKEDTYRQFIFLIPPRPLLWSFADALTASNEIIYDEQPRLVFRFEDDTVPNECGYFEMDSDQEWKAVSVGDYCRPPADLTAPRPSLPDGWIQVPMKRDWGNAPRGLKVKLAHRVGPNRVKDFMQQKLVPLLGPRPGA